MADLYRPRIGDASPNLLSCQSLGDQALTTTPLFIKDIEIGVKEGEEGIDKDLGVKARRLIRKKGWRRLSPPRGASWEPLEMDSLES